MGRAFLNSDFSDFFGFGFFGSGSDFFDFV
jgi:hypothetical protein